MYTVVVADDEFELRQAIIEKIDWKTIGFEVVGEAENGVEALDLVERLEPDLLLTDIKMPFISGIELARRVREIRPSMQIVFLSGYDDFQYAQQAIQYNIIKYLLKPISSQQLTMELQDIKKSMDERQQLFVVQKDEDVMQLRMESFLMSALLDYNIKNNHSTQTKEAFLKQVANLHVFDQSESSLFLVIVTRFYNGKEQNITHNQHANVINAIARKHIQSQSFYSKGKIVSLFYGMEWEIEKYIDIITNEIIQTTKRVMNQECFIGVGGVIEEPIKAHTSFHEACSAIDYGQGVSRNLSFIHDIERKDALQYEYIETIAIELEHLLKVNRDEEAMIFVKTVFQDLIKLKVSLTDIDLLLMHVISRICTLVRSLCDDHSTQAFFEKASVLTSQLAKYSLEEKEKNLEEFCRLCKDTMNKQNRLNGQVICDELMELIDQEYAKEDFSLTIASERLYISASYLSALLKKITGESFVVLLTKKRMEVAKEKVLYSSAKILEIAKLCGYNDQHYFSYCFKRQYGVSPNKMREQNNETK